MIYNPGFTFSNINGKHRIGSITETDMPYVDPLYSEVIIADEVGSLVKIYSDSKGIVKASESPALQFARININDNDAIIDFCNRYGLPLSERNFANFRNDYLFFDENKDNFTMKIPLSHKERDRLSDIKKSIIEMRYLLDLNAAISSHDLDTIVKIITFFCLDLTKHNGSPDAHVKTELFQFNHAYRRYTEDYCNYQPFQYKQFDFTIALRGFLNELVADYAAEQECQSWGFPYKRKYVQYDFTEWRHLRALFDDLLSVTNIIRVSPFGEVEFSTPLAECNYLKQLKKENLLNLARAVLSDLFKHKLDTVSPEIQFESGRQFASWRIPTLIDAMYLELFFRFSPNGQIRKCADPKCTGIGYFEWTPSKPNQKYCCNTCAMRIAKQEQRKRDKKVK